MFQLQFNNDVRLECLRRENNNISLFGNFIHQPDFDLQMLNLMERDITNLISSLGSLPPNPFYVGFK